MLENDSPAVATACQTPNILSTRLHSVGMINNHASARSHGHRSGIHTVGNRHLRRIPNKGLAINAESWTSPHGRSADQDRTAPENEAGAKAPANQHGRYQSTNSHQRVPTKVRIASRKSLSGTGPLRCCSITVNIRGENRRPPACARCATEENRPTLPLPLTAVTCPWRSVEIRKRPCSSPTGLVSPYSETGLKRINNSRPLPYSATASR